ncbi:MAG: ribose 5-phosphate isomerase A [Erysipelotrichia bacterium]|nr:ribose 5-phosphate isomerase A [Erysipelotrichia bacterium]NCC55284.1 ribose 5-phosphate isomerase A [Erysipelotrichia bacterium]
MKQRCAKEAFKMIENHSVIGLGGGRTIAYLVDLIAQSDLDVKIVTPSFQTECLCLAKGLIVLPTHSVDKIDLAFDGCDEVDQHLNALKSGGGIHTKEKIIATMAKEYVLLVDESKVYKHLAFKHPVVLEIVKDSYHFIVKEVAKLNGKCQIRSSANKDGGIISDQGLLLVDVMFENVNDIKVLHDTLRAMVGVLEISLFVNVATKALVVLEDGYYVIEK